MSFKKMTYNSCTITRKYINFIRKLKINTKSRIFELTIFLYSK